MSNSSYTFQWKRALSVFITALKLGFMSFGGPIAHLVYFQDEYVKRRKWLNEQQYNELVALAQFLPGPTSSQVGIAIGTIRAGIFGGLLSFIGFTLPSMLALIGFASILHWLDAMDHGLMQGLKLVAVAMVAHIVLGMIKSLLKHYTHWLIAIAVLCMTLLWSAAFAQPIAIAVAMVIGMLLFKEEVISSDSELFKLSFSKGSAIICLCLFFGLLFIFPFAARLLEFPLLSMVDQFFRAGALVFGGGHIVLPLLEREVVHTGQMSAELFFAGYSATQAVPGPLFTFASYLGYVLDGWRGAVVATASIFLPAFLLIFGCLPFWNSLRRYPLIAKAFKGASCGVVGILVAAFINPIVVTSITQPYDALLALVMFLLLHRWKCPAWLIVLVGPLLGLLLL